MAKQFLDQVGATILANRIEDNVGYVQTTYDQLLDMRDNAALIPGNLYRFTYCCLVRTGSNLTYSTAELSFDLILLAVSTNEFSPEARAARCYWDTYFLNSDLSKWKIWYDIDPDPNKYNWVNPSTSQGVIYRMIDEFGNDCPYDFKNILFKRKLTDGSYDPTNGTDNWVFTFNYWDGENEACLDASIVGNTDQVLLDDALYGVHDNKMAPYIMENYDMEHAPMRMLNNIVFLDSSDDEHYGTYNNIFGLNCYSNTFGDNCRSNIFGQECYNNTVGYGCSSNTFGNNCYSNTFGLGCNSNTFGNHCRNNTFGHGCSYNNFGIGCDHNTFGRAFSYNTFGNDCAANTFGNTCQHNTFGNTCAYNNFGDSCFYNTFGTYCRNSKFGGNCEYNTLGNDCNAIEFANTASGTPNNYYRYITVENNVEYVRLRCGGVLNNNNHLQNIRICTGIRGTYVSPKQINPTSLNNTFLTEYKPQNSQIITI